MTRGTRQHQIAHRERARVAGVLAHLAARVVEVVLELQVSVLEQLEILAERIALQLQLLDASVPRPQLR